MDEFIAGSRHHAPRHLRISGFNFSRQSFCCFADNLKIPNHSIHSFGIIRKRAKIQPFGVLSYFVRGFQNIINVKSAIFLQT